MVLVGKVNDNSTVFEKPINKHCLFVKIKVPHVLFLLTYQHLHNTFPLVFTLSAIPLAVYNNTLNLPLRHYFFSLKIVIQIAV